MMVMVTLGGLPAGTYRVGIGEFSGGAGGVGGAAMPNTQQQLQSDTQSLRGGRPVQPPGTGNTSAARTNPDQAYETSQTKAFNQIRAFNRGTGTAPAPAGQPAPIQPGAGGAAAELVVPAELAARKVAVLPKSRDQDSTSLPK